MKKELINFFLIICFLLAAVYFFTNLKNYLFTSLQADFSAYYTAGEAIRNNLNPYKNNINHDPMVWDGIDAYVHSRFIYPPLTAYVFTLLTIMPYFSAKLFWLLFNLLLIFLIFRDLLEYFKINRWKNLLICLTVMFLFYPSLALFERGQIDLVTLFLLVKAIRLSLTKKNSHPVLIGFLLAWAALFKIYVIFTIPFLLIKKKYKETAFFVVFFIILFFLPVLFKNSYTIDYLTNQLPRISRYGESGPDSLLIKTNRFPAINITGRAILDEHIYRISQINFIYNASLSRLNNFLIYGNWNMPSFYIQGITLMFFCVIIYIFSRKNRDEFLYWILSLLSVLLTAPLTWPMNLIWLLIIIPWLIKNYLINKKLSHYLMLILGLVVIAIPDYWLTRNYVLFDHFPYNIKYILGIIIVFIGLIKSAKYSSIRAR